MAKQPERNDAFAAAAAARRVLKPYSGRGIFITATGTDVGKTVATAAFAGALRRLGVRVGILKPVATGCQKRSDREPAELTDDAYVAADATFSAAAAGIPVSDETLHLLSPVRYVAPAAVYVAAELEMRPIRYDRIAEALAYWEAHCDVLLVEGAGGLLSPIDRSPWFIADLAAVLGLPLVVVSAVTLGTINGTLLTVEAIRQRNLPLLGLVFNNVPPRPDLAESSSMRDLAGFAGTRLLATLPRVPRPLVQVPEVFIDNVQPYIEEWWRGQ